MTTDERVRIIYNYLRAKDLTDVESKAIIANIDVETGGTFDPTILQKGSRKDPAFGLFQFDPRGLGLAKPYMEYVQGKEDPDPYSLTNQLDFMAESITGAYKPGTDYIGAGVVSDFRKAAEEGLEPAIKQFSGGAGTGVQGILNPGKPHMDRRLSAGTAVTNMVKDIPEGINVQITTRDEEVPLDELQAKKSFFDREWNIFK